LREHEDVCKICKTKFPKLPPKFINGYAKIKNFADDTSPFDIFYTIDTNYKKQGLETWYEDKVIKYEIPYVNNIKHGLEKHYEYGSICSIIPYEYGKIHGVVIGYKVDRSRVDEDGNFVSILYSTTNYENGNIIKDSKKFYDTTTVEEKRSINTEVFL
jgi:antitoxin component YwqK of YwqJK toxin-antitoxin module